MKRTHLFTLSATLVLFAACTADPEQPAAPTEECPEPSAGMRLVAENNHFGTGCLTAPAGEGVTIELENLDEVEPHNFSIYRTREAQDQLFGGELFTGPGTMTYEVPALEAGRYFFRCDVHPADMNGTYLVE